MPCRHYLVTGRVQGVFYRASTQEFAARLGATGWVRNCSDGSVELLACADEPTLQQLEQWLSQGPRHAQVTAVEVQPAESKNGSEFSDFSIRY